MRRLFTLAAAACGVGLGLVLGCAGEVAAPHLKEPANVTTPGDSREATASALRTWVADASLRRSVLESSLVKTDNAYARLRLERYDEAKWGSLTEVDPPTTPIMSADIERSAPATDASWSSMDADRVGWSAADLRALGERAFFSYPVQVSLTLPTALKSADRSGVWEHQGRMGAVWARFGTGNGNETVAAAAFTCATCHASIGHGGALIAGRNNADLDIGRMAGDGVRGPRWGLGRVDVTSDGVEDPIAITDLRPIRWQENLHHAATLRNDPKALATRVETLIITSHQESIRPPRKVVAAIVFFLLDMGPTTPMPSPTSTPGAVVFARECASCHRGDGATGSAMPIAAVGTDPLVGQSTDRGTGMYRIPSLRSVGDRRRLFASGAIEDITDLVTPSPDRQAKGHPYGLTLSDVDRAALLEFLRLL